MKVPRKTPGNGEKGRKRQDPSGKNMRPANSVKNLLLSCELKLKVPVYKVPVCEPSNVHTFPGLGLGNVNGVFQTGFLNIEIEALPNPSPTPSPTLPQPFPNPSPSPPSPTPPFPKPPRNQNTKNPVRKTKSEEIGLFPPFSGFPRCCSGPPEKGEKGRKRAKKADFGRFPGRAARRPLKPPFVTPPFAAAQPFEKPR